MTFNELYKLLEERHIFKGDYLKPLQATVDFLEKKEKVLFLTTSNRWDGHPDDVPKSTQLAYLIQYYIGKEKCQLIEVPRLNILPCEGNVSSKKGNNCGVLKAALKDKEKNPTGNHRCWTSFNEKDDELWKISRELFKSDTLVIFGSIRWGQMNSYYQKLIERLTWLENRHTTFKESNIIKDIDAGLIAIGQNWNGAEVVETQRKVLDFFGFKTPSALTWNWQYTKDPLDETQSSYKDATKKFDEYLKEDKIIA